jgi:NAD(P)H dehydrogenase (quinone)
MSILITGASGQLGRRVVRNLLERGVAADDIVAGARNPESVADLGVRAVHLDYTEPASIAAALEGVQKVVLISGSEVGQRFAQHSAVIDAAAGAGLEQFVYTSAPRATTSALILAPEHKATEEAIATSGLPATILRNNWYTENYVGALNQAKSTGEIITSAGEGRVASATRDDFAEAIAAVLTTDGHIGAVYELGGDVAWEFEDLARAATELLGTPVTLRNVSPEEHTALLTAAGVDEGSAGFAVALDGNIRDGALAEVTGDLSRLIGRPTTSLVDGLRAAL